MDLRPENIIEREFTSRRRGYDMDEVDEFLELIARRIHHLEQELEEAHRRLAKPVELAGHQLAELFARAQEIHDDFTGEAEAIRTNAREETAAQRARMLEEARSEASEQRARASKEATALVEGAEEHAERVRREAEGAADARIRSAEEAAERVRREAEDSAEARTRAAEEKVRAADERLEHLKASESTLLGKLREIEQSLRAVADLSTPSDAEGNGAPADATSGDAPDQTRAN